jgi:RimJ/RimL family protein N-acetyltransferase
MSFSVYIRPLEVSDAKVSHHWRNNPKIWRYTGTKPCNYVSPEKEEEWIREVLKRDNEKRFAICVFFDHRYIGNVYFTDIHNGEAQLHIFIVEMDFWTMRRTYESICLILDYGFNNLELKSIYAQINPKNSVAVVLRQMIGFKKVSEYYDSEKQLILDRIFFNKEMYAQQIHLDYLGREEVM